VKGTHSIHFEPNKSNVDQHFPAPKRKNLTCFFDIAHLTKGREKEQIRTQKKGQEKKKEKKEEHMRQ